MIYLDSSVLLEVYLDQPRADEAFRLLRGDALVSSRILAVEVPVSLRRVFGRDPRLCAHLARLLARFAEDLRALAIHDDLAAVAERVRADARYARCRSLDAIHAATAAIVQELSGRPIVVATFDARLAEVCAAVGLVVVPSV